MKFTLIIYLSLEDSKNIYRENKFLRGNIMEYEDKTDATSNQAKINNDALKQLKRENSELLELVKDDKKESKGLTNLFLIKLRTL